MEGFDGYHELNDSNRSFDGLSGELSRQGSDIVRDVTDATRRIADVYRDEAMNGELWELLHSQEPAQRMELVGTMRMCDEFHAEHPEGTPMSVAGVGLVVVRYPMTDAVAVAPLDGGARLVGDFQSFDSIDAPVEDDVAHVVSDMDCARCEQGDHVVVQSPAMHLANARLESLEDGTVLMEFDADEYVFVPLGYPSLTFGRVTGETDLPTHG